MRQPDADNPAVIVVPPLLYAAALALVLLLHWAWPLSLQPQGLVPWVGWALLGVGVCVNLWGVYHLRRVKTAIDPRKAADSLVTDGPFAWSRNPLYLGLNLVFLGLALVINTLWGLLVFVPVVVLMHHGVILREEQHLEARFGDAYRAYRRRVRRYL